jgi:hypothetical protein
MDANLLPIGGRDATARTPPIVTPGTDPVRRRLGRNEDRF